MNRSGDPVTVKRGDCLLQLLLQLGRQSPELIRVQWCVCFRAVILRRRTISKPNTEVPGHAVEDFPRAIWLSQEVVETCCDHFFPLRCECRRGNCRDLHVAAALKLS